MAVGAGDEIVRGQPQQAAADASAGGAVEGEAEGAASRSDLVQWFHGRSKPVQALLSFAALTLAYLVFILICAAAILTDA